MEPNGTKGGMRTVWIVERMREFWNNAEPERLTQWRMTKTKGDHTRPGVLGTR